MAVDAEEAGMDAFMDKPFKLEELTAVYTKLLARDNQSTRPTTGTPGVDTQAAPLLGAVARGPRSIYNVTKNAKIFIDAGELDDISASQTGGATSSLEQDGASPTYFMVVAEGNVAKISDKTAAAGYAQPPLTGGDGSGNGMISGIKLTSAKVHAAN